mmetsp:Transcript_66283/g.191325  ORF Transcript_66283/g.191325 Transcript_66283/m.191325 type:complete len:252 (-) Transcript_66283:1145-1900(-)
MKLMSVYTPTLMLLMMSSQIFFSWMPSLSRKAFASLSLSTVHKIFIWTSRWLPPRFHMCRWWSCAGYTNQSTACITAVSNSRQSTRSSCKSGHEILMMSRTRTRSHSGRSVAVAGAGPKAPSKATLGAKAMATTVAADASWSTNFCTSFAISEPPLRRDSAARAASSRESMAASYRARRSLPTNSVWTISRFPGDKSPSMRFRTALLTTPATASRNISSEPCRSRITSEMWLMRNSAQTSKVASAPLDCST